jgi:hypothetical protein
MFPGKNNWKTEEVYDNQKYLWRGMIALPNYRIRIYKLGNVDAEKASDFTKITEMATEGLFDTAKNPYAGAISDKIVCPENLKPTKEIVNSESGLQIHYMTSSLNSRLQYGACTENQISYKVFSGIFYCQNVSEWFQMEIIVPASDTTDKSYYKNLFIKTSCQKPDIF